MKLMKKLSNTFTSLKYKNFRYFMIGQCISVVGTWIQRTAQVWLVYSLTKSAFLLGLLGVFQFGPVFLCSLFAGVLIDRFPKKKLIIFTQFVFMIQSLILAYLVWIQRARYWQIAILALIFGFAQTLDMPARQAYYAELVGKADLMNAISLNSTIFNLARVVGPSVAGILLVKLGAAACFFINGISFIPVIYGLYAINAKDNIQSKKHEKIIKEIIDSIKYIMKNDALKFTLILMIIVCIFSANSEVIIPVFTNEVLKMGARGYTFLLSALGFGAFCGAIFMASRSKRGLNKVILIWDSILISMTQIFIYFIKQYYFVAILIVFIGFFYLTFLNMSNSTLQMNITNDYRGRVMSVYALITSGSAPIGNSFAGYIMERSGANMGYFACGLFTLVLVSALLLFHKMRRLLIL